MSTKKERAARFSIEQAITLELTRERFIHAEGVNLSESGMLLETDTDVEPMTSIYLMFTIPYDGSSSGEASPHRIICEGSVARVDKNGEEFRVGVQFSSMEDEDKRKLRDYLASLSREA